MFTGGAAEDVVMPLNFMKAAAALAVVVVPELPVADVVVAPSWLTTRSKRPVALVLDAASYEKKVR